MRDRARTFADHLRHFSHSVDIVDDRTFDGFRTLVYRYVREELEIDYFELMREQSVDGKPGLGTFWSSQEKNHVWQIRPQRDKYGNLITASYDRNKPLWIVNSTKASLLDANAYEDQWSGIRNLPIYEPAADAPIRTLIVVPLRRRRVLGVYFLETQSYISITPVATRELQQLGDAIAILFELWEVNRSQSRFTQEALSDLDGILRTTRFPKLTKPRVFVAYSDRADRVVNVIQEVLDQFSDKVEITRWDQIRQPGNITVQIAEKIAKSKFGVCYFSEPVKDATISDKEYVDNSNVIFEAGMLHALTNSPEAQPLGWIPIREEKSPRAPFDFSTQRITYVPRMRSGELNETRFRQNLEKGVRELLGEA